MKPHILVVDDDEMMRALLKSIFEQNSCFVITAEDGDLGYALATTAKIDLIITDNDMPQLTGIEMIRSLRRAGNKTPIIFSSGLMDQNTEREALTAGANAAIHKPYTPVEIRGIARKFIDF